MKYYYQIIPKATITFTDDEFNLMWESCKHHYDGIVQSLTEQGSWLYGLRNKIVYFKSEYREVKLTFRQIDLILKSLEMTHSTLAYNLFAELRKILQEMNDNFPLINELLAPSN